MKASATSTDSLSGYLRGHNSLTLLSAAVGTAAAVGSAFMLNRIWKLESELNEQDDTMEALLEQKHLELQEFAKRARLRQTSGLDEDVEGLDYFDEKPSQQHEDLVDQQLTHLHSLVRAMEMSLAQQLQNSKAQAEFLVRERQFNQNFLLAQRSRSPSPQQQSPMTRGRQTRKTSKSKFLNELKDKLAASPERTSSTEIVLKPPQKDDANKATPPRRDASAGETSSTEDDKMLELKPQAIDKSITIISNKFNQNLKPPTCHSNKKMQSFTQNVHCICITGGLCAGRDTAIARIRKDLVQLGYKVLVVPNTQARLMKGTDYNCRQIERRVNNISFLRNFVNLQASLEDCFVEVAKLSDPGSQVVILVDRGLLDISAHTSHSNWNAMLHDMRLTPKKICQDRYDAVIHMVTAADGAQQHYNTHIKFDGHYISAEEARKNDEKLRKAYMNHPRWIMVRNTECTSFDDKIEKTKQAVLEVIQQNNESSAEKLTEVQTSPLEMDSIATESFQDFASSDNQLKKNTGVSEQKAAQFMDEMTR